jgi:hypothetical protein
LSAHWPRSMPQTALLLAMVENLYSLIPCKSARRKVSSMHRRPKASAIVSHAGWSIDR